MTQEEKQLLTKVLCELFPYGVMCRMSGGGFETIEEEKLTAIGLFQFIEEGLECVPYLRPMSSMTEEEKQRSRWYQQDAKSDDFILYMNRYVEWLDSKHFDWRTDDNGKTMIEKGLALEATEGMYS